MSKAMKYRDRIAMAADRYKAGEISYEEFIEIVDAILEEIAGSDLKETA